MASHSFKSIPPVPSAEQFVDIVLLRTTRRTPSVVHPQYKISRIRDFYMRKVRFTHDTIEQKLTQILDGFPKIDDVHPFYSDLISVLYDRDHYKVALGHLAHARRMVKNIANDYDRLLKYGDSAFRCKNLKRAALGRMCTVLRKLKASLGFLEEVRQHMSRLPSIDPTSRTLLVAGFPNVGKSSFMNHVTEAKVEVQPYPFTTKSLFVGHCDYKYERWQVIDTPGILDRSLEERNAIEMTSITALAHLESVVLFFVDISDSSSYTVKEQLSLLESLKPLFASRPLVLVATKVDVTPWEKLNKEERSAMERAAEELEAPILKLSNMTAEGVASTRNEACELLRARRVAERKRQPGKMAAVLSRLTVSMPKPRDGKNRPASIPPAVIKARAEIAARRARGEEVDEKAEEELYKKGGGVPGMGMVEEGVLISTGPDGQTLLKDVERAAGGAGRYSVDLRRYRDLEDESWAEDIIPEIQDGRNVADYIDEDIWERLQALEEEQAELEAAEELEREAANDDDEDGIDIGALAAGDDTDAILEAAASGRLRGSLARAALTGAALRSAGYTAEDEARLARTLESRREARRAQAAVEKTKSGLPRAFRERGKTQVGGMAGSKRGRSVEPKLAAGAEGGLLAAAAAADALEPGAKRPKTRSRSVVRNVSHDPAHSKRDLGLPDLESKSAAIKMARRAQRKPNINARKGEGDRHIPDLKPKHLFSGKRGIGKTDRR